MAFHPTPGALGRRGYTDRQRDIGKKLCETGGRDWSQEATAKAWKQPPEPERGKERLSLRAFRGSTCATNTLISDV